MSTDLYDEDIDFYDKQVQRLFWRDSYSRAYNKEIAMTTEKEDTYVYSPPIPEGVEMLPGRLDRDAPIVQYLKTRVNPSLADTNLKTAAAQGKPRLSDVPPVALLALGAAMSNGKDKYGRFNWRETGSTSSVFFDAMMRHLLDWYNGEDFAEDSSVHHLGHLMASCAILLDSALHGKLNDDREHHESVVYHPEAWRKLECV